MTYKKNWAGVCLWAFYALAVFAGYAKALYDVLQAPHVTNHYIQFGIVFFSLSLVAAVFIQIRRLASLLKRPVHVLWEALLFVLLFAAGVFLRICFISKGTEHAAYFETAMVNGSPVTALAHGAQYFYVLLLRGLFLLTGNHFTAGIILQICLQMLAAVVWYLAVKRLSGRTAALVLFGGLMLIPASIGEGLLYSPKMLYMLLCGIVLLMIGRMGRRQAGKAAFRWYTWLQTALTGVGIGLLLYLDVSGLLFFVPVLFLPFLNGELSEDKTMTEGKRLGRALLQLLLVLVSAIGVFVLLLYMDALQNGAGIGQVLATWRTLFAVKGVRTFPEILKAETVLEAWVLVALAFLMLIGVLAFFVRRKEEVQIPWLFFAAAAVALYAGGFCADGMDCEYMLLTAALMLTGTGLQAAFCRTENAEAPDESEEPVAEEKEAAAEPQEIKQEEHTGQPEAGDGQPEGQPQAGDGQPEEKQEGRKEQPEGKQEAGIGQPEEHTEQPEGKSGFSVLTAEKKEEKLEEPERKPQEGQKEPVQQSPQKQNQTESDVSQMSYNSEYGEGTKKDEQDSLWALFAGDDGAAKPLNSESGKSGGKKAEAKKAKEQEKKEKEKKVKEKKAKEKKSKEKAPQPEAEQKAAKGTSAAVPSAPEKTGEKKTNYIENPLPLPKKHVKKTMEYQAELSFDKMDFDIDVPDTDDFDI